MWVGLAAVLLALLIAIPVIFLMGGDSDDSSAPTTTPTTQPPPPTTSSFTLYFLADHIQNSNVPGPHLMPVGRTVDLAPGATPVDEIEAALEALIGGFTAGDSAEIDDLSTGIPAGTELLGVTLDQGVATVDFNETFASGAGTFSVTSRLAQVVYTATAIDGVDAVVFAIDGEPVEVFSSEGVVLDGAQQRADYAAFLPLVMVQSPLAGAEFMSPVTVSGVANAFEAHVSLRAETLGGETLAETFTTATCGTGCFGDFAEELYFDVTSATVGRIIALEYSANDGSPVNVFAVPVTFLPGGEAPPVATPEPRTYDVVVADGTATALSGSNIVTAAYGSAADQVGFDPKGFGPCCFDVSGDGQIVLLDAQNTRIIRYGADGGSPTVLFDFDPADFVPDAVAVIGDTVVAVGMTNRPTRPYDAVALSLADGEILQRVESTIDINGDLRATTDGVFWAAASSEPRWMSVANADGTLIDSPSPLVFAQLPGESTLSFTYGAGVEVSVQPAGDSARTTYDIAIMGEWALFAEVLGYQRYADGAIVLLGGDFDADNRSPVIAIELGTTLDDNLTANQWLLEIERSADTGSFGTFRYAYGGLYAMSTTDDGVVITRYELGS